MRIRTDDAVTRTDQPLLRQQRVLDAHATDIKEVFDIVFPGKNARLLDLLRRLDVLIRREVIHHQCDARAVIHAGSAVFFKFVDRYRRGDIIAKTQVQFSLDQLTGHYRIQTGMRRQQLLRHGHSHKSSTFQSVKNRGIAAL